MKVAQIRRLDSANGSGIAVTVFLSGCKFFCKGCFNREYADPGYGEELTEEKIEEIIRYLKNPHVNHLSLLGGEPLLLPEGPTPLIHFLERVKKEVPGKKIWIWSGYTLQDLQSSDKYLDKERLSIVTRFADYFVDGRFVEGLASNRLLFRGSSNQIIWRNTESGFVRDELNDKRL